MSYLRSCTLHVIKSHGLLGELKVDQCILLEKLRADKHEDVMDQLVGHGHKEERGKAENQSLQQARLLLF